jgi:hypothetical protein
MKEMKIPCILGIIIPLSLLRLSGSYRCRCIIVSLFQRWGGHRDRDRDRDRMPLGFTTNQVVSSILARGEMYPINIMW